MKKEGKTLTIFLILIVVILVAGVSISLFLLNKETQKRQETEVMLDESKNREMKLQGDLTASKKQNFILDEKNKEADKKINDLMDDLDIEEAVSEELRKENANLKEVLEAEAQSKKALREKLGAELTEAETKMNAFRDQLAEEKTKYEDMQTKFSTLESEKAALESKVKSLEQDVINYKESQRKVEETLSKMTPKPELNPKPDMSEPPKSTDVELEKIVVSNDPVLEGRVISVDKKTEFLIFDMGKSKGIEEGDMMSIYRGKKYLGDVKVSRVQDELSAADFVPPFSSRKVRKNDTVKAKE